MIISISRVKERSSVGQSHDTHEGGMHEESETAAWVVASVSFVFYGLWSIM